ncbi:hypothetical protein RvY_10898 [Ramazzottius varieornatus]|uniref:Chromo domain-containing protein n=1 Tax=Ramazzottius varieornatus TaxID=947166 RepID=A0A1D1VE94_RAMVA|nr:hypothetical protein RvY_10898 [Ramazzottius varieornatus]
MGVAKAAKLHAVCHGRLKKRLCELGYVMKGSGQGEKRIKAPVSFENNKAEPTATGINSLASQEEKEWTEDKEGRNGHAQPAAQKEEVSEEAEPGVPEVEEIERIADTHLKRQYLVKWQGEEEATWVDEDVFLGLTNLQIK